MPEIDLYEAANDEDDVLYAFFGADRFAEFRREGSTATTFRGRNGAAGVWEFTDGGTNVPDTYTLHDQNGNTLVFFGFDGDASPVEGQLWTIEDPAGNMAYVGHSSNMATAISNGYTAEGFIKEAFDTSGRRYTYTYTNDAGSTKRLTRVKAEVDDSGWVEVGRVDYEYYGDDTHGDIGDLKLVEITTPLSDSGVSSTRKKYYRYWDGESGEGAAHEIKMIVGFEGTRAFDWAGDATFNESFLTASDENLEPYADAYFEYTSGMITTAFFGGECGCGGGSDGVHTIAYGTNGSYTNDGTPYDQEWYSRAVVTRPDGTFVTQYFDEVGQPLSQVITDGNPTGSPNRWATKVERNSDGLVTTVSSPASVTAYTHSTGVITTSSSVGLIWNHNREGSNARAGFVSSKTWQEGTSGTPTKLEEYAYENFSLGVNSDESTVYRPIMKTVDRYPSATAGVPGSAETTTADPVESAASLAVATITTENPSVSTANNGSNSSTTRVQYLRDDGTVAFVEAEDGVVTYWEYTDGQLTKTIEDADEDQTGDFDTTPPTTDAAAVHRVTTYAYDAQGRRDTKTRPDGRVSKSYYSKLADGRLVTLRYADFEAGTPKFHGPVQYTVTNLAGKAEVQATVALSGNESTTALTGHVNEGSADPITAMTLGAVARLATSIYDEAGSHVEESRVYFDIPASGAGADGTNYDATLYGYDDMGRQWRTKAPHGTINRTVYDALGRVSQRWTGTNDNSFDGGEASGTDNMVKTEELEYDGGADDGNGYLTERTLFVEGSATGSRVTAYTNDVRGRATLETQPTTPHALHKYDNYGRRVATGLYSSTTNITVGTTDPTSSSGGSDGADDRLALNQTFYDEMGRVWKTTGHQIDASDGSDDDNLESLNWYDAAGRGIKTDGSQLTKTFYDRLGRQTHQFVLAVAKNSGGSVETAYADADDVAHDIVLEEHQTVYELGDSDDVLMSVAISRFHDDFSGGTAGALDSNADGDDLLLTAANVEGRPQITAFWYDRLGRVTDTVRYGTNGGSNFDRDGLSVPARSDTALLTENTYDTDGTVHDVTDPKALVTRTLYDDAGRTVATIRNYVNGTPSGPTGDDDVYTRYTYVDGLQTEIWVDLDGDGTQDTGDQVTTYTYGTTKGTSAGDSKIATGHLLQETAYPDSASASDVVSMAYNAQGQEIWKEDQAGNVLESEYDTSGRRTKLKITTLASGFDGAVRLLQWAYTSLGQVETLTSYDAVTSGSAVNEVKYAYDGWGNVTSFKQDKDGTVGGSGFYEVAYTWAAATTGRNTLRKTGATQPSGNVIDFDYVGANGFLDDATSRVTRLSDGAVRLVRYAYNGVGHVVGTDHDQPNIMWSLFGSSAGSYPDLDQFNRITSSRWTSDLATDIDFFDVHITYDRNSNITRVVDNVHVGFDWSYEMDDLDRLERAERGTWSGSAITTQQEDQTWTLDQVGNWDQVTLDFDADNVYTGTEEYNDDRSHNDVNELTGRDTDDDGTDEFTLVYDAVGNLTDDGESYKYVYDPLGRMRKILDRSDDSLVAEYKYNGLGHMIAVHEDTDTDGDVDGGDKWFYPVYDERWRQVANFRENDSAPKEEWVNQDAGLDGRGGSSYINGVVLRDRDADTAWNSASDGTLEERIFICQNWRGDVSALVYANGDQVEQVRYSPYGTPFGLPGGDCDSDGDCDSSDVAAAQTWASSAVYDARGDMNLDGTVSSVDIDMIQSQVGISIGRSRLSGIDNLLGWQGSPHLRSVGVVLVRARAYAVSLGRWMQRDPASYSDSLDLYAYGISSPVLRLDPSGAQSTTLPCGQCWSLKKNYTFTCPGAIGSSTSVPYIASATLSDKDYFWASSEGLYASPLVHGTCQPGQLVEMNVEVPLKCQCDPDGVCRVKGPDGEDDDDGDGCAELADIFVVTFAGVAPVLVQENQGFLLEVPISTCVIGLLAGGNFSVGAAAGAVLEWSAGQPHQLCCGACGGSGSSGGGGGGGGGGPSGPGAIGGGPGEPMSGPKDEPDPPKGPKGPTKPMSGPRGEHPPGGGGSGGGGFGGPGHGYPVKPLGIKW